MRKFLGRILAFAMLCTVLVQPARATDSILEKVHGDNQIQSFTISDDAIGNKEDLDKEAQQLLDLARPAPRFSVLHYSDHLAKQDDENFNGGVVSGSFDVDVYVDSFPGSKVQLEGESRDFWYGGTPINATSISASEEFYFSVLGFSNITISAPPSVDLSVSDTSATLTYPVITDEFSYYHIFSNIMAESTSIGVIASYRHTHSNTFQFGNRTVTTSASDTSSLW